MTTSKMIAGLIGPTLIAIAVSLLVQIGTLTALIEQGARDPALIYVSGILIFVAGVAIVRTHNRWTSRWPVLVTVVGWLALLGGLLRMLFPTWLGQLALGFAPRTGSISAAAVVLLVIGVFLFAKAYRRESV
jgi:hypothetical protein